MLELLPRMNSMFAAAIVDWRDPNSEVSEGGAEDETYQRLSPAYRCKNAKFESIDELRLVYGMDLELLYGEDANANGVLDLNENDGDQSFPLDNRDGRLDPGLLEYVTVYTQQPTTRTNGSPRVSVTNQTELATLLLEKFESEKASEIQRQLGFQTGGGGGGGGGRGGGGGGGAGGAATAVRSVLEFYIRSGMTAADFAQIEEDLTAPGTNTMGLINVNTASAGVLSCIPGIGLENAPALTAYRQNNRGSLIANPSMAWVADVLNQTNAIQAGPYLTGRSYQYAADIAAVGHHGRGYRRVKFILDISQGTPRVVYRQDLSHLGWALGREARDALLLSKNRQ
jgi:type II secretory pathway component PulK